MAERRMFAKTIVLSDAFLDLPMSARCLYFTLGMLADDDGFVNAPRSIMRQCGASDDDMKNLLAKKFVLLFDSGVIVIKHWRINNYLRSDRYSETKYVKEKAALTLDENGSYKSSGIPDNGIPDADQRYTNGIPGGIPSIGKDSIDKFSEGKDRLGKGESEGENPTTPPAERKPAPPPAESSGGLAEQQRANKVQIYAKRIAWMRQEHYDPVRMYKLAAAEGITADEIDVAILGLDSI